MKWPEAAPKSWRESVAMAEPKSFETMEQVSDCDLMEPVEMMETTRREGNRVGPDRQTGDLERVQGWEALLYCLESGIPPRCGLQKGPGGRMWPRDGSGIRL